MKKLKNVVELVEVLCWIISFLFIAYFGLKIILNLFIFQSTIGVEQSTAILFVSLTLLCLPLAAKGIRHSLNKN